MGDSNKCRFCMYVDKDSRRVESGIFGKTYYLCQKFNVWRSENANACDAFVGDHNCFLTTACVRYKGLEDDCRELTALRNFRDGNLATMPGGKELIEEYYQIGPSLIEKIDASQRKNEIYEYIYSQITTCLDLIEKEDYQTTKECYVSMVEKLKSDLF